MNTLCEIEISPALSEEIRQEFIKRLNDKYYLVYTDYQHDLENYKHIIQDCITEKCPDKLYEELDRNWLDSAVYERAVEEIEQISKTLLDDENLTHLHPHIEQWLDTGDNKDEIRYIIEERDKSTPIQDCISRTRLRARAMLHTNYDCLPDNWSLRNTYSYTDYVKDIIDVLNLNPYWVMRSFHKHGINTEGKFPDLKNRNGKESVRYDDFTEELQNQCSYGILTFAGMLPLRSLWDNDFREITHITIPKGNYCVMFNDWNGGGSLMEMKLVRDLKIPVSFRAMTKYDKFILYVDEAYCDNGYCINDVYGLEMSWWKEEFRLSYK